MKKNLLLFLVIGPLFSFSTTYAVAEEPLYVQPYRAKIYSKPSIASEVLCLVDSGFQFVSIGKEGNWIKFVYKGRQGFIPAVQAGKNPPLGKSAAKVSIQGTIVCKS